MLLRALATILKSGKYLHMNGPSVCSSANPLSHRSIYLSIFLVPEAVIATPVGGMRS